MDRTREQWTVVLPPDCSAGDASGDVVTTTTLPGSSNLHSNQIEGTIRYSRISDDTSCNHDHHSYKECEHWTTKPALIPFVENHYRSDASPSGDTDKWFRWKNVWICPSNNIRMDVPADLDWSDLVTDLYRQLRGMLQSKFQIGAFLWELSQTYQMVTNPFGLLKEGWRIFGHQSCSALARRGANLWLEGRYGWRPFFYDISCFADACQKVYKSFQRQVREGEVPFSSRRMHTYSPAAPHDLTLDEATYWAAFARSNYFNSSTVGGPLSFPRPQTLKQVLHAERLGNLIPHYSVASRFLQAFGADWESLMPTLWEITPFSFVVDWFIGIKRLMNVPANRLASLAGVSNLGYSISMEAPFDGAYLMCGTYAPFGGSYRYLISTTSDNLIFGTPGVMKYYHRIPGCPDTVGLSGQGLDLLKLTDIVALVLQRR